jgi:hypothetical protein
MKKRLLEMIELYEAILAEAEFSKRAVKVLHDKVKRLKELKDEQQGV